MPTTTLPRKAITIKRRRQPTLVVVKRTCPRCEGAGELILDGGWESCGCGGNLQDEWIGLDELVTLLVREGLVTRLVQ